MGLFHTVSASHEMFPGHLPPQALPLCLPAGASQLHPAAMGKNILFPWNTEKREEKYSCRIGAEEWTPEIPGRFTSAPVTAEFWLHSHTDATTFCTNLPGYLAALAQMFGGITVQSCQEQKMTLHTCHCG